MKPVIVFSAVGLPEDFVVWRSLQQWRNDCNIFVITSRKYRNEWNGKVDKIVLTKSNSRGLLVTSIQKILRRAPILAQAFRILFQTRILRNISFILMPPHNSRHFYYRKCLSNLDSDVPIFLVDSRDLVFQVNPVEISRSLEEFNSVCLFTEGKFSFKDGTKQLNGLSYANLNWALELINFKTIQIQNMLEKEIINSGCIFGQAQNLDKFLFLSERALLGSNHSNISLLDQASVNFLAYCMKTPVEIFQNGEHVLNMCGIVEAEVELSTGKICIEKKIIPIIHQFDRFGVWDENGGFKFGKRDYKIQTKS